MHCRLEVPIKGVIFKVRLERAHTRACVCVCMCVCVWGGVVGSWRVFFSSLTSRITCLERGSCLSGRNKLKYKTRMKKQKAD